MTTFDDGEQQNVHEFHKRFGILSGGSPGHLTRRKLMERVACLQEELNEFTQACVAQDLEAQADALIDLVYFAKGTAAMLGLPWRELWDDVQRANVSKVRGPTARGFASDVTKPPGWVGPRPGEILADAGYVLDAWMSRTTGAVEDRLCRDDGQNEEVPF